MDTSQAVATCKTYSGMMLADITSWTVSPDGEDTFNVYTAVDPDGRYLLLVPKARPDDWNNHQIIDSVTIGEEPYDVCLAFLCPDDEPDYHPIGFSQTIGSVRIDKVIKIRMRGKHRFSELYTAYSNGKTYYIKTDPHSKRHMPYVLNPVGVFKRNDTDYYVYPGYDGSIGDLFNPEKTLYPVWKNWDNVQKERFAAKILLSLLFTLRSCYTFETANLDIKPDNILYLLRESQEPLVRIIDIAESENTGDFLISQHARLERVGTPYWIAPALFHLYTLARDTERARHDGSEEAAKYADIYSIGLIFYMLYSQGGTLWKSVPSIPDLDSFYRERYTQFYYSRQEDGSYRSSATELENILPDALGFAADPTGIAALIGDMLSFTTQQKRLDWCERIIRTYCGILARANRLPEMDTPPRYLPETPERYQGQQVILRMDFEMSCDGSPVCKWSEYRCQMLADGDVCHVPLTLYHMHPEGDAVYRQKANELLFLMNDCGTVCYRMNGEGCSSFGELDYNQPLELNVSGRTDTGGVADLKITFTRKEVQHG